MCANTCHISLSVQTASKLLKCSFVSGWADEAVLLFTQRQNYVLFIYFFIFIFIFIFLILFAHLHIYFTKLHYHTTYITILKPCSTSRLQCIYLIPIAYSTGNK